MKRVFVTGLLALPLMLTSCNTIQGIGKDIQDGGQAMSTAINGKPAADREFNNH